MVMVYHEKMVVVEVVDVSKVVEVVEVEVVEVAGEPSVRCVIG